MENAEYYDNDICLITIAKNKSNPIQIVLL